MLVSQLQKGECKGIIKSTQIYTLHLVHSRSTILLSKAYTFDTFILIGFHLTLVAIHTLIFYKYLNFKHVTLFDISFNDSPAISLAVGGLFFYLSIILLPCLSPHSPPHRRVPKVAYSHLALHNIGQQS